MSGEVDACGYNCALRNQRRGSGATCQQNDSQATEYCQITLHRCWHQSTDHVDKRWYTIALTNARRYMLADQENLHMKSFRKAIVAMSLTLLLPLAVSAQSLSDLKDMSPEDRRAAYENMSDEERTAIRDQRRATYDAMSEEERQAMRKERSAGRDGRDRDARHERWESMSEEERTAAREKHRAKKDERRQRWESMSDEERAAAREKRGSREGQRKRDHAGQGGHDGQHGQYGSRGDRR